MSKEVQKYQNNYNFPVSIQEIAKQENIPITGITIMGGRPYINVTGLDVKLRNKCRDEKLELIEIRATRIQDPIKENGYLCGYHAEVVLFDKDSFLKSLTKLKEVDKETLKELKDSFTYRFTGEGWASPATCEAIGFKYEWINGKKTKTKILEENIIMMAERRATNRAKREATGTGLTSVDELPLENISGNEDQPKPKSKHAVEDVITEEDKKKMFNVEIQRYVYTDEFREWAKDKSIQNLKEVKGMLKVYFNTENIYDLTLDQIKEWQEYINRQDEMLSDEEDINDPGQGENQQGSLSGSGNIEGAQGDELFSGPTA